MSQKIQIRAADGHTFSAYRAGPANARRGLVVVQEIFGVNQHMRNVCDEFAAAGYAVISPALFDRVERDVELGYGNEDMLRGRDLRGRTPEAGTLADIEAAAAQLALDKVAIVGYCWGGTVAWWGATRSRKFACASGWYGGGIAATAQEVPNCPVQLHFGELDKGIPLTDVEAIRKARPEVEIHVYPGAQHGFACDERPSYSAADTQLAQSRTLAFFDRHMG